MYKTNEYKLLGLIVGVWGVKFCGRFYYGNSAVAITLSPFLLLFGQNTKNEKARDSTVSLLHANL